VLAPGISAQQLVDELGHQLHHLPPFRRRAIPVPYSLGHPVWIEDPEFNLANHVRIEKARSPGTDRDLADVVAKVAGKALPRDRPLWEMVVVEGLEGGGLAVVAKIHHAVADGAAAVALLENVVSGTNAASAQSRDDEWRPEAIPSRRELVSMALRQHAPRLRGVPSLLRRSVRGLLESNRRRRSFAIRPAMPLQTPKTSFNVSLAAARTFAITTLPFEDLRAIRHAHDATINDVYLCICAGGLRRYLEERGELPDKSLVASVPVSTDPSAVRLSGNRVDNLYVAIGTEIADPLERLARIHAETTAAKDVRSVLGNELFEQRAEVVPPQLYSTSVRAWTRSRLANRVRPPVNLVLSNVPGPKEHLFFGQIQLEALYSVGPILEGVGLNITAWSYVNALHLAILGSKTSVSDPWAIAGAIQASFEELRAAAGIGTSPAESP
jgi:diacylglycerol O-acyltransferase